MLRLRSRSITSIVGEVSKAHQALGEDPQDGGITAFQEDLGIRFIRQVPLFSNTA